MTEDQNEQTTEGAGQRPGVGDHSDPGARDHGPGRHPHAGCVSPAFGGAPPAPPAARHAPHGRAAGLDDPAQGSTPPQGTYAMGALAGNPMLGAGAASSFGGPPPTDPGAPMWPAPPAPGAAAGSNNHRLRNGLLAGAAALAVLGAGVGIGHATLGNTPSTQAFSPPVGHVPGALGLGLRGQRLTWLGLLGQPVRQRQLLRGLRKLGQLGEHGQLRQLGIIQLLGPK